MSVTPATNTLSRWQPEHHFILNMTHEHLGKLLQHIFFSLSINNNTHNNWLETTLPATSKWIMMMRYLLFSWIWYRSIHFIINAPNRIYYTVYFIDFIDLLGQWEAVWCLCPSPYVFILDIKMHYVINIWDWDFIWKDDVPYILLLVLSCCYISLFFSLHYVYISTFFIKEMLLTSIRYVSVTLTKMTPIKLYGKHRTRASW